MLRINEKHKSIQTKERVDEDFAQLCIIQVLIGAMPGECSCYLVGGS